MFKILPKTNKFYAGELFKVVDEDKSWMMMAHEDIDIPMMYQAFQDIYGEDEPLYEFIQWLVFNQKASYCEPQYVIEDIDDMEITAEDIENFNKWMSGGA